MAELARELSAQPTGVALVAGAETGARDLGELLLPLGWEVQTHATYRTTPATLSAGEEPRDLGAMQLDAIFLSSPSALAGLLNVTRLADAPRATPLITLGPTTSAAVKAAGLCVTAEAKTRDLHGLIRAVCASTRSAR
jgi:uroporphyrinogen-III synthase